MEAWNYARNRLPVYLSELLQFLSIPSISAQEQFKPQMEKTAGALRDLGGKISLSLSGALRRPAKSGHTAEQIVKRYCRIAQPQHGDRTDECHDRRLGIAIIKCSGCHRFNPPSALW